MVQLDADRALEKAKQADKDVAEGKELGPLHGLPMTIKDAYSVEGVVSTGGNPYGKNMYLKKMQKLFNISSMQVQLFLEKQMSH